MFTQICKGVLNPNVATFLSNCIEGLHFSAFHCKINDITENVVSDKADTYTQTHTHTRTHTTPHTHTHTHTHTHHTPYTHTHTHTHTHTQKQSKVYRCRLAVTQSGLALCRNACALSGPLSQCNATSWSWARNLQVD